MKIISGKLYDFTVINLVLCDESDELIAGALDLHYTTIPQLNINQIKVQSC